MPGLIHDRALRSGTAFEYFGGVFRTLRYDNMTSVVKNSPQALLNTARRRWARRRAPDSTVLDQQQQQFVPSIDYNFGEALGVQLWSWRGSHAQIRIKVIVGRRLRFLTSHAPRVLGELCKG
jgi:hypothetical protein